jgi:hypothetical protein
LLLGLSRSEPLNNKEQGKEFAEQGHPKWEPVHTTMAIAEGVADINPSSSTESLTSLEQLPPASSPIEEPFHKQRKFGKQLKSKLKKKFHNVKETLKELL